SFFSAVSDLGVMDVAGCVVVVSALFESCVVLAVGAGSRAGFGAISSSVKTFLGFGADFFCSRALRAASATGSPVLDGSCCAIAAEDARPKPIARRHVIVNGRIVIPPGHLASHWLRW